MQKLLIFLMGMVFVFGVTSLATAAGPTATQQVTLTVSAINEFETSGVVSLDVNSATAGYDPNPAAASSSYAITTNGANKKITGQLDSPAPDNTTLYVTMSDTYQGNSVGNSTGKQLLSPEAVDLVTGISHKKGSSLNIDWEFSATLDAEVASTVRTVTFTLTN